MWVLPVLVIVVISRRTDIGGSCVWVLPVMVVVVISRRTDVEGSCTPFMAIYALSSMFTQNTGKYFTALFIAISGQTGIFPVQPAADLVATAFGIILKFFYQKYFFDAPPTINNYEFRATRACTRFQYGFFIKSNDHDISS